MPAKASAEWKGDIPHAIAACASERLARRVGHPLAEPVVAHV